jgi:voltage-gated potassium channel
MNFLERFLISIAYRLKGSERYYKIKHFFYNILENDKYPSKRYFDFFMIFIIFCSVVILIAEVKHDLSAPLLYFNDYIISVIFVIEYVARVWVYDSASDIMIYQYEKDIALARDFRLRRALYKILRSKLTYMRSVKAIIDLLAIVPFFHELRLLRIFILFRVFKLFRYTRSIQTFASVLLTKKFEFLTLLTFAAVVVCVSAILVYIIEANNPDSPINSLFQAFYWAIVTISTVGYGDVVAVSDAGRVVSVIVIISGIAVMAFTTSLVVSAFTEKIIEIKEMKDIDNIAKQKNIYLICGYSEIAHQVASRLQKNREQVIIIDKNIQNVANAQNHGFMAFALDPGLLQSYSKLQLNLQTQVKAVLCLDDTDIQNIYIILTIRSMSKNVSIMSLLQTKSNRKKMELAGANQIIFTQEFVGLIAKELLGKPVAFELIHSLRSEVNDIQIAEILIDELIAKNIQTLKDLHCTRYRLLLLGIYKHELNHFLFSSTDETQLEIGDMFIVIGSRTFIDEFKQDIHIKKTR